MGMLLFPGEEIILDGVPGYEIIKIEYMGVPGINLLMCRNKNGCDRSLRPLACRIFPVAPDIIETGQEGGGAAVIAAPDIRGRRMCPVWNWALDSKKNRNTDKDFIAAVQKAFDLLAADKAALDLMRLISREINELRRFYF
jgi:hypothetical protein